MSYGSKQLLAPKIGRKQLVPKLNMLKNCKTLLLSKQNNKIIHKISRQNMNEEKQSMKIDMNKIKNKTQKQTCITHKQLQTANKHEFG